MEKTVCTRRERRHKSEAKVALRSPKSKQNRRIRFKVPRDESQVSVGGLLALGYGRKWRTRKKR
jgi:hypothetical protein